MYCYRQALHRHVFDADNKICILGVGGLFHANCKGLFINCCYISHSKMSRNVWTSALITHRCASRPNCMEPTKDDDEIVSVVGYGLSEQ